MGDFDCCGLGEIGSAELSPFGAAEFRVLGEPPAPRGEVEPCPFCEGSGDRDADLCGDCAGTGLLHVDDADHADYAAPVNHDYRLPEQRKP